MASYTLFISGLSSSSSPDINNKLSSISAEETVIVFDSVDAYTMALSNEKTSFPIESRSSVSDHIYSTDGKFNFTGYVTSSPLFIRNQVEWDKNTDRINPRASNRIRTAYEVIKAARDSKSIVSLSTEEFDLPNYVITNFEFSKQGPSEMGTFNISLEEMRIVTIGTTVLATDINRSSDIEAGKTNQNKGSTQSGSVQEALARKDREVRDTTNKTSFWTDLYLENNMTEVIPQSEVKPKVSFGQ